MKVPIVAALFLGGGLLFAQQQQKQLTTNAGAPVGDNQNTQTAGPDGPQLLQDIHAIEKLSAFDRERIPERVVHARGVGIHGVFVSYGDFSQYTKAEFLNAKGKETPLFVRFSTVMNSMGSPETLRDPRGFAVKFYTQEGNYDIVGNNLPVFFIRDAIKFPDFVHALKPSPVTNRQDPNRMFDFLSLAPESTNMLTYVYSNLGTPANYRQMNGFGVHAFEWVNANGKVIYVKYKWTSLQGVENITPRTNAEVLVKNYQVATDDMYEQVGKGNYPSWELSVQIVTPEELSKFDFNPFDDTKIWPENVVPSMKIGKMTLNKMPDNYFQETEQAAFAPGNLVPGIEASPDRMLQGRLFAYLDTQRYRVGPNFQQLPINRPVSAVNSYNQNGPMDARQTHGGINYQPNHAATTIADNAKFDVAPIAVTGAIQQKKIANPDNYRQAGDLYRSLSKQDQDDLITNLVGDLSGVRDRAIVVEMVSHFYKADSEYGTRLAKGLNLDLQKVTERAAQL
ncbi:catalase [Granulicella sp. WH15]|uniref:catalase n=1 Tax=Granulicella sp. WH15 TaxID=2602070 RepID=UPI001366EC7E|nr:catalase [Granulicella sp. WH15]QHN03441.1 catalase [Granulicella sp. WH15]